MRNKKKKALTGELYIVPYRYDLILMRANTFEELKEVWDKAPLDKEEQEKDISRYEELFNTSKAFVTEYDSDNKYYLVYVCKLGRGEDPGSVAHEAYHIMNRIYENVGYTPDVKNDEASAYFLDYLVTNITNFLNED